MAELIVIYWRDIPSQVMARAGRKKARTMLPPRFMEGIDRAAMRAGKGSSDAYMEDWHRERETTDADDLQAAVERRAAELADQFNEEYLERLVKAKGLVANLKTD
ncbi:MAG: hypothetical protein CSB44_09385 [Gammaproteobacteria bacterium]|nr:MAG: hypothetical protein CSB44_09385 [Gammaproteobacteria bacterium]